ncbi:hypothetical protein MMC28_009320 [Mycoblastus sanguinarius]|nr:hypothetical protein [Mycoblastus sanguinarius]
MVPSTSSKPPVSSEMVLLASVKGLPPAPLPTGVITGTAADAVEPGFTDTKGVAADETPEAVAVEGPEATPEFPTEIALDTAEAALGPDLEPPVEDELEVADDAPGPDPALPVDAKSDRAVDAVKLDPVLFRDPGLDTADATPETDPAPPKDAGLEAADDATETDLDLPVKDNPEGTNDKPEPVLTAGCELELADDSPETDPDLTADTELDPADDPPGVDIGVDPPCAEDCPNMDADPEGGELAEELAPPPPTLPGAEDTLEAKEEAPTALLVLLPVVKTTKAEDALEGLRRPFAGYSKFETE